MKNSTINNKTLKRVSLGVIVFTLALGTLLTSMSGIFEAEAGLTVVSSTDVYFNVPEVIYLKPGANTFQYYSDQDMSSDGTLTVNASATDTSGRVDFYYANTSSVTITQSGASSVTLDSSTVTSSSGKTYSTGSVSNKQITAGTMASSSSGYITWTATYLDSKDGITKKAVAYSYVYAPNKEVSALQNAQLRRSTIKSNREILNMTLWVAGATFIGTRTSYTNNDVYSNAKYKWNIMTTSTAPGTKSGSSTEISQSDTLDGCYDSATGNLGYHGYFWNTDNNDGGTRTLTGKYVPEFYYDSSRVSNLNQIPNFKIGLDIHENWGGNSEGNTSWSLGANLNNSGTNSTNILTTTSSSGNNDSRSEGRVLNKAASVDISSVSTSTECRFCSIQIARNNGREANTTVYMYFKLSPSNKSDLRTAVKNAQKEFARFGVTGVDSNGKLTSNIYSSETAWTEFRDAYYTAVRDLTKVDASTSNDGSTLNTKRAALRNTEYTATVIYWNDKTNSRVPTKSDDTIKYKIGDTVTATSETISGVVYQNKVDIYTSTARTTAYNTRIGGDTNTVKATNVNCTGLTFVFHYMPNSYKVTLDPNFPDTQNNSNDHTTEISSVYVGDSMPDITKPSKSGWTFNGYYDAKTGGTQYIKSNGTSAKTFDKGSNTTLYGQWTVKTYGIRLADENGTDKNSFSPPSEQTSWTSGGLTLTYDSSTKFFTINGTVTTDQVFFTMPFNFSEGGWVLYTTDCSGTFSSNGCVVVDLQKGTNGTGGNTSVRKNFDFRGDNQRGYSVASGEATGLKLWVWSNQKECTYTNAKFKLHIEKGTGATYGQALYSVTKPTKTGYTFGGYYTGANGSGTQYITNTGASAKNWDKDNYGVTLYAKWTKNTYTVTYSDTHKTGGSVPDNTSHTYDTASNLATYGNLERKYAVTFDVNDSTKGNGSTASTAVSNATATYTFNQWNTVVNSEGTSGTGTARSSGAAHNNLTSAANGSVTLYAVWNTGSVTLTNPTRTGYTFAGWKVTTGAGVGVSNGTTMAKTTTTFTPTSNVTLTAQWTANPLTVNYNANNGTGTMTASTFNYDTDATAKANGFIKTGYTFAGWNTNAAGTGTTYVAEESSIRNIISSGSTTLYAQWTKNTYTVTYSDTHKTGGSVPANTSHTYDTVSNLATYGNLERKYAVTFDVNDSTKGNGSTASTAVSNATATYTFNQWNTGVDSEGTSGTGIARDSGAAHDNLTSAVNGSVTLYAVWDTDSVTLTNPTRTGYTFAGWKVTSGSVVDNITNSTYATSATSCTPKSNVTLQAQWTAKTVKVTYEYNGAVGKAGANKNVTYDSTYETLPSPIKPGYTFDGWYTASSGGNKVTSSTVVNKTSNHTIYARWITKTYTITTDKQSGTFTGVPASYTFGTGATIPDGTRTGYNFDGWVQTYHLDDTYNWSKYWIDVTYGTVSSGNTAFPNTLISDPVLLRSGVTYTLTGKKNDGSTIVPDSVRWRGYKASTGEYVQLNTMLIFTPSQDIYVYFYDLYGNIDKSTLVLTASGYNSTLSAKDTGNVSFTAHWTHIPYTITYNTDDGSTIASKTYYIDDAAFTLGTTTKTGNTFSKWSVTSETSGSWTKGSTRDASASIATGTYGNVSLKAIWTVNKYYLDVNWDYTDGNGKVNVSNALNSGYAKAVVTAEVSSSSSGVGDYYSQNSYNTSWSITATVLDDNKYIFLKSDGNYGTTETRSGKMGAQNHGETFHIRPVANIVYSGNDTSSSPANCNISGYSKVPYGVSKTVTSTLPTRTGYEFMGWNTASDGSGTSYSSGSPISNNCNTAGGTITLYAQWKAKGGYTITFNENDGTSYNLFNTSAWDPRTRWGCTYSYTQGDTTGTFGIHGKTKDSALSKDNSSVDIDLFEQQIRNLGDYVFVASNKTGTMEGTWVYFILYNDSMEAVKYRFLTETSFYPNQDKVVVYRDLSSGAYSDSSNEVWYNTYADSNSNIKFKIFVNTNTSMAHEMDFKIGLYHGYTNQTYDAAMKTVNVPSRDEYDFLGYWTKNADGSWGTQYYNSNGTSKTAFHETGDTVLYARWKKHSYTVTFDGNGKTSGSMSNQEFEFDEIKQLSANAYQRKYTITYNADGGNLTTADSNKNSSYTFAGWKVTNNLNVSTAKYGSNNTVPSSVTADTVLGNQAWVKNLNRTKGTVVTLKAQWSGGNVALPTNPTKDGYNFDGWKVTSGSVSESLTSSTYATSATTCTPTSNVTLTAQWTPITYTVSFNGNSATGGSTASDTYTYNTAKALRSNGFTRAYTVSYDARGGSSCDNTTATYDFSGWKVTGGLNTKTTPYYGDSTAQTSTVTGSTILSNGAYVKNLSATQGATVTLQAQWTPHTVTLPTSTKTGYTLRGWYIASSGGTKIGIAGETYEPNATTTLYAQWDPITYTVRYNGNGSTSGSVKSVGHTYDTAKNLEGDIFTRSYTLTYNLNKGSGSTTPAIGSNTNQSQTASATYTLSGWAKTTTGDKTYDKAQSVSNLASTQGATVDLYAKWTGGSVTLATPTRDGYTFAGWYTAASGGTRVGGAGDTYTPGATKTIYAQWTPITYTVKYDNNYGTGSIADQGFTFEEQKTLTANNGSMSKTGYTFAGWSEYKVLVNDSNTYTYNWESTNTEKYKDIISWTINGPFKEDDVFVLEFDAMCTGNFTNYFYGNKSIIEVKTVLSSSGEKNEYGDGNNTIPESSDFKHYVVTFTMGPTTDGNCTKNLMFRGWKSSKCSVKNVVFKKRINTYTDAQSVKNLASTNGAVVTLSANWTPITYTINYNKGNGTGGSTASTTHTYGVKQSLRDNGFTKTFGIVYDANGGECTDKNKDAQYTFSGWATSNGGTKVYSDSEKVMNLASTQGASATLYAVWGDVALTLPTPTREGYYFDGWYTAKTGGTKVGNAGDAYHPSSAGTLYAHWNKNPYTVEFDNNGGQGTISNQGFYYDTEQALTLNNGRMTKTGYTLTGWTGSETIINDGKEYHQDSKADYTVVKEYDIKGPFTTGDVYVLECDVKSTGTFYNFFYYNEADTYVSKVETSNGASNTNNNGHNTIPNYSEYTHYKVTFTLKVSAAGTGNVTKKLLFRAMNNSNCYVKNIELKRYYNFTDGQTVKNLTKTKNGTVTLYAKWEPNTYTITYNGNGNDGGSTSSSTHTYDSASTLTPNGFTRSFDVTYDADGGTCEEETGEASYEFTGWKVTSGLDASNAKWGTSNNPTASVDGNTLITNGAYVKNLNAQKNGSVTLTAQWSNASVTFPQKPTKVGYTFDGWKIVSGTVNDSITDGKFDKDATKCSPTSDIELKATWKPITYTVNYVGNGSTRGSTTSSVHTFGTSKALTSNGFTKGYEVNFNTMGGEALDSDFSGYVFDKWVLETGTTLYGGATTPPYTNNQEVLNLASTQGATVTLKATWTQNSVILPEPHKTGYEFVTWCSDEACKNSVGNVGDEFNPSTKVTIYAKWKPIEYNIAFNTNGGSGSIDTITNVVYDTTRNLPDCTFKKTGYHFVEWNTKDDGTGKSYTKTAKNLTFEKGKTVTLYAIWEANKYTVKLHRNGNGDVVTINSTTEGTYDTVVTYDKTFGEAENGFPNAKRVGYTFIGWYTAEYSDDATLPDDCKQYKSDTVVNVSNVNITDDTKVIDLYAYWKPITYTITIEGMDPSELNTKYGEKKPSSTTIKYGEELVFSVPSRDHHKFLGWSFTGAAEDTAKYSTEDNHFANAKNGTNYGSEYEITFKNLAKTEGANVKITASWRISKSTLVIDPNGGEYVQPLTSEPYTTDGNGVVTFSNINYSKNIAVSIPEREGFDFDGWERTGDNNGTWTMYSDHGEYTFGPTDGKTDYLTAKWKLNPYNLFVDTNGGSTHENILYYNNGVSSVKYDANGMKLNASYEVDGDMTWSGSVTSTGTKYESDKFLRAYLEKDQKYVFTYTTKNPNVMPIMYTKDVSDNHYISLEYVASAGDRRVLNSDGSYTYYIYYTPGQTKSGTKYNTMTGVTDPEEISYEYRILFATTTANTSTNFYVSNVAMKKLNNLLEFSSGSSYSNLQLAFDKVKENDGDLSFLNGSNDSNKTCNTLDGGDVIHFTSTYEQKYVLTYTATNDSSYFKAVTVFGTSISRLKVTESDGDYIVNNGDGTFTYVIHFTAGVNTGKSWTLHDRNFFNGKIAFQFITESPKNGYTTFSVTDIKLVKAEEYMVYRQLMESKRYIQDPIRVGYHVTKWSNVLGDGNFSGEDNRTYQYHVGDASVIASWETNKYNVKYVLDDRGVNPEYDPADEYTCKTTDILYDEVITVTAPTRTGFVFDGWIITNVGPNSYYVDETDPSKPVNVKMTRGTFETGPEDSIKFFNLTDTNAATVTFTAKWKVNTYTVKFNGNRSTGTIDKSETVVLGGTMDDQNFTYGVKQNLSENIYFRKHNVTFNYGYNSIESKVTAEGTFKGWSKSSEGEAEYLDKAYVKNLATGTEENKSRTLYAVWEFDLTLPDYTRTGWILEGWYVGGTRVGGPGDAYVPTSDVTVLAKWVRINYYLNFHGNGYSSGTMGSTFTGLDNPKAEGGVISDAQKMEYDTPDYIIPNAYKREATVTFDYNDDQTENSRLVSIDKFLGWNTKQNGTGIEFEDGQYINENLTTVKDDIIDLYAQWEDGYVTLPEASRDGWDFLGWFIAKDSGTEPVGRPGDAYYPTENTTLFAHWEPAFNIVTFENGDRDYEYFNAYQGTTSWGDLTYTGNDDGTVTISGSTYHCDFWKGIRQTANPSNDGITYLPFNPKNGETYSVNVEKISGGATTGTLHLALVCSVNNNYTFKNDIVMDNNNSFTNSGLLTFTKNGAIDAEIKDGKYCIFLYYETGSYTTVNDLTLDISIKRIAPETPAKKLKRGGSLETIVPPTREGYTFLGYYTAEIGGELYYPANGDAHDKVWDRSEDTKLYAHWTTGEYTIQFNKGNSTDTGTMKNQKIKFGTLTALDENQFKCTGKYFDHWEYTVNNKKYILLDGQSVCNLTSPGGTITLTAIWSDFNVSGKWIIKKTYDFTQATNVRLFTSSDTIPASAKLYVSPNLNISVSDSELNNVLGKENTSSLLASGGFSNENYDVTVNNGTFIVTFVPGSNCASVVQFFFELYFNGYYYTGTVFMYPANVVLYEENSFSEKDSVFGIDNNNGASWYNDGSRNLITSADTSEVYGFSSDINKIEAGNFSGNTVSKTILTENVNVSTTKEFEFTGNGFDLISACGPNTAAMVVYVWQYDSESNIYNPVSITTVDTYLDDASLLNSDGILTQVPIYHFMSTENTRYLVQVYAVYLDDCYAVNGSGTEDITTSLIEDLEGKGLEIDESVFGMQWMDDESVLNGGSGAESEPIKNIEVPQSMDEPLLTSGVEVLIGYLDGIRVYKPGGDTDPSAYNDQPNEKNASFYNVYQYSSSASSSSNYGGKLASCANEVYVKPGESVAIKIGDLDINSNGSLRSFVNYRLRDGIHVMISLRAVKGKPNLTIKGSNVSEHNVSYTDRSTQGSGIVGCTEMYRDITTTVGSSGIITFTNTSTDGAVFALCNVKITYSGTMTEGLLNTGLVMMDEEDMQLVAQTIADESRIYDTMLEPVASNIRTYNDYQKLNDDNEDAEPVEISIKNMNKYNGKTIDYKSTITFTSTVKNGNGAAIVWYVNGKVAGTGEQFTMSAVTENFTIYCATNDSNGDVVTSETESIKVTSGFFAIVSAFFKGLFGSLPEIVQ